MFQLGGNEHSFFSQFFFYSDLDTFLIFLHSRFFPSYNGVARQHGRHWRAKKELDWRDGSGTSTRGSRRWTVCQSDWVRFNLTVTFQMVRLFFRLTVLTCLQPYRPRLPPVCRRTMEASPPTGSTSSSTSWGRSSPPNSPGGRSRRCPPLVLLKRTMRRVSPESWTLNILII